MKLIISARRRSVGSNEKYHPHRLRVIGWNLYVIAGLVMLAAAPSGGHPKGTLRLAVFEGSS
jgi:hypothetical protein